VVRDHVNKARDCAVDTVQRSALLDVKSKDAISEHISGTKYLRKGHEEDLLLVLGVLSSKEEDLLYVLQGRLSSKVFSIQKRRRHL